MTPPIRRISNRGTLLGIAVLALAIILSVYATASGVHCPDCDRQTLGASYESWRQYFVVKDIVWAAAFVISLLATPFAYRRWPGVLGILAAGIGNLYQPL